MILQRDKIISIWGTSQPDTTVSVAMQGQKSQAISDQTGKWTAQLGPFHTSVKETLTIRTDTEHLQISDVAVGEVWLAGGQSNMEFPMQYDADFASEKTDCNFEIHFFDYPEVAYPGQLEEADYTKSCGFWRKCTPSDLSRFSAVGYYFAKKLNKETNIPVGIIGCNWGGTPACAWMSEEAIVSCGGSAWIEDYKAAIADLDIRQYTKAFRANAWNYKTDFLADPMNNILLPGYSSEQILEKVAQIGYTFALNSVMGPFSERRPMGLYHSMLTQVAPFGIRGVLWYQGEADDEKAQIYSCLELSNAFFAFSAA